MKPNSFAKSVVLGVAVLTSVAMISGQGAQLLSNKSFENLRPGYFYPASCLPGNSGAGGGGFFPCTPDDYFLKVNNWDSHYHIDPVDCNPTGLLDYVHSPDWVGGNNDPLCGDGWDQGFNAGMGAYEAIWQNFGGGIDDEKCYEVRIKTQIVGISSSHRLNVLLGTQQFFYQNDQLNYPSSGGCIYCDPNNGENYGEYIIAPSEQLIQMKEFPVSDLISLGSNPYAPYSYNNWFEFHGKINMNQLAFNFAMFNYVQFGLDVRFINGAPPNCDSPYLIVDWIEFFESCPDSFEIYGAMIAGQQDEYIASNYIKAGDIYINKGPAIVTSNGRTAFKATNYIELVPGFLSDYGSNLEIMPQNACSCPRDKSLELANPLDNSNSLINNSYISHSDNDLIEQSCNVFPNPTTAISTVTISNQDIFSITLLNNNNQTISSYENINKNQFDIDISSLISGVYYIIVQTTFNDKYYRKIIKL